MKLRTPLLILLTFVVGASAAAFLGMLDRDACLDAGGRWIIEQAACEVPAGTSFVPVSRRVTTWLGWGAALAVAIFLIAWVRHANRPPLKPGEPGQYVYIDDDGSARELTPDEEVYLATEFLPGDGAAPYVKSSYRQRTSTGLLRGYLARRDLPRGIAVRPAPPKDT
jgi:hypothetical protein